MSQLYLDNSSLLNSGDLTGDTFNVPLYLPYGDVQYLGGNTSFDDVEINGGTMTSGTLNLNLIGINTANLLYVFPFGFTVAGGTTLTVAPSVNVQISPGQTITDSGTMTFGSYDSVSLVTAYGSGTESTEIQVNGVLDASTTTFTGSGGYFTEISINPGGHLIAAGSTFNFSELYLNNGSVLNSGDLTGDVFNVPLYLPYSDVQYLGGNISFDNVEINGGTMTGGTLNLNLIGINTTNLIYVFSGNFTVAAAATVNLGPNVPRADRTGADDHRRWAAHVGVGRFTQFPHRLWKRHGIGTNSGQWSVKCPGNGVHRFRGLYEQHRRRLRRHFRGLEQHVCLNEPFLRFGLDRHAQGRRLFRPAQRK